MRTVLASVSFLAGLAMASPAPATVAASEGGSAESLRARHAQLAPTLDRNAFGRPINLESREAGGLQKGEVYAVVDHPFTVVQRGLTEAQSWCDVMILPYNTKHCHAAGAGDASQLALRIGRKADQSPEDAQRIDFRYEVQARTADYMRVVLAAPQGPLGTRDYRIVFEATPIDAGHTFVHLGYSYGFGTMARLAMQTYLATAGAHKVGFTVTGRDERGSPVYVKGMLGATERNTMRYFLAIDAYLGSLAAPETQRLEKRLNDWYMSSLQYPKQLHELEKGEYLAMKRREAARMKEAL